MKSKLKKQNTKHKIPNTQRGITLVALIITIIVLLILAMVSIRLVMNGGIIDRAERGTQAYSEAEIQEQIKLAYSEWQTAQWTSEAGDAATFVQTRLRTALNDNGLTVTESNGAFTVTLTGGRQYSYAIATGVASKVKTVSEYPVVTASTNNSAVTENSRYIADNKTAVIPAGYAISNESTEQSIDNGLVIKKDGNEWVWIPVANVSDLYIENTTETSWIMYGTSGDNVVESRYASKSEILTGQTRTTPGDTSGYREPDTLGTLPDYLGGGETDKLEANYTAAGFSSFNDMATKLRDDYKNMIDSVRKYGGFYVGRYELGKDSNNNPQVKAGTVYNNVNWYELYAKCKVFEDSNVYSRMMYGCTWDQMCIFISTSGDQVDLTDSSSYGNYGNSTGAASTNSGYDNFNNTTGRNSAWKANNIYDIAGNCNEWTQEASTLSFERGMRGGSCLFTGSYPPVSTSSYYDPTSPSSMRSSRPVLYLK